MAYQLNKRDVKREVKRLEKGKDTPELIAWLDMSTGHFQAKRLISDALGRIGDPLAVDSLLGACCDQDAIGPVLKALARIGDRRAVFGLCSFMAHWGEGRDEPGRIGFMNRLAYEAGANALRELLGDDMSAGIRDCDAATAAALQRYHRIAWWRVASWGECPLCGGSWTARIDGAVQCSPCYRYFCDFDRLPSVSDGSEGTFGALTGTSLWSLTLTEKWIAHNDEREGQGLVRLPYAIPWRLSPTLESRVALRRDEPFMSMALSGGRDTPPQPR